MKSLLVFLWCILPFTVICSLGKESVSLEKGKEWRFLANVGKHYVKLCREKEKTSWKILLKNGGEKVAENGKVMSLSRQEKFLVGGSQPDNVKLRKVIYWDTLTRNIIYFRSLFENIETGQYDFYALEKGNVMHGYVLVKPNRQDKYSGELICQIYIKEAWYDDKDYKIIAQEICKKYCGQDSLKKMVFPLADERKSLIDMLLSDGQFTHFDSSQDGIVYILASLA